MNEFFEHMGLVGKRWRAQEIGIMPGLATAAVLEAVAEP